MGRFLPLLLCGSNTEVPNWEELDAYLTAYGVTADRAAFVSDQLTARARARALLAAANAADGDLLIMGAYGEHHLDAIFGLGRATQKVVTACRLPVVMAH